MHMDLAWHRNEAQTYNDPPGFEPRDLRMRSGCDTTTPCAQVTPTMRRSAKFCMRTSQAVPPQFISRKKQNTAKHIDVPTETRTSNTQDYWVVLFLLWKHPDAQTQTQNTKTYIQVDMQTDMRRKAKTEKHKKKIMSSNRKHNTSLPLPPFTYQRPSGNTHMQ